MVQRITHAQRAIVGIVALMIALILGYVICVPTFGHAAEPSATGSDPVVDDEPNELQQLIESTGTAYTTAITEKSELEQRITELEDRVIELEAQLPAAQDAAADSIYILYRLQLNSNGLVELLLSTDDFNSFITMLEYLENISSFSTENLIELNNLVTDLKQTQQDLNNALQDMIEKEEEAQQALANAQAAREEKERQAAQTVAEEAAAHATKDGADDSTATNTATEETATDTNVSDTSTLTSDETYADLTEQTDDDAADPADAVNDDAASEEPAAEEPAAEEPAYEEPVYEEPVYEEPAYEEPVYEEPAYEEPVYEEPPVEETTPAVSERDAFIAEWGSRINNYLAGSPLAGYGETFAAAAWDYDVDPRWSPAIACVESSLGRYCNVGSYNAWGWDHTSWGSWEEAIYAHVQGLANGYGYTLTEAAAQKYCPPSWQNWYNNVSAQMSRI